MQENEWSWYLSAYLRQEAVIHHHHCVETPYAEFVVDYLVEIGNCRLGILLGQLDELPQRASSAFRDALSIDAGIIDILYRFDEADFNDNFQDCLSLIAKWNPELFSERGLINIERLASREVLSFQPVYHLSLLALSFRSLQPAERTLDDEFVLKEASATREDIVFRRMCRFFPDAWLPDYKQAAALLWHLPRDVKSQMDGHAGRVVGVWRLS